MHVVEVAQDLVAGVRRVVIVPLSRRDARTPELVVEDDVLDVQVLGTRDQPLGQGRAWSPDLATRVGPTMDHMRKLRTPIVWLLVAALVLSVGAGFFSVVF